MKRLVLALAATVLLVPNAALAKGPTAATLNGPGVGGGGISFSGYEGSGSLGDLTQHSGWFAAVFEPAPNQPLSARPTGELGPKYTVTYTVPGPSGDNFIRQDVYPYADSGPVAYMAPGQPIFDQETRGGWFQAGPELKRSLVAAGLPESPPTSSPEETSFPTAEVTMAALVLTLLAATAVFLRRRTRPAPAA